MKKKVDITVVQKAISIVCECPHCEEEIEIDFDEFIDIAGDVCDWNYAEFSCPKCFEKLEIDSVDWS